MKPPVTPSTRANRRRGATVIEFSLVFILFITMVAGVFELGRAIWAYNTLMHAAKQGVRYAMVHGARNPIPSGGTTVENYTKSQAVGLAPSSVNAVVNYYPDNKPGSKVKVSASHTLNFVVAPLLGFGSSIQLKADSVKTVVN